MSRLLRRKLSCLIHKNVGMRAQAPLQLAGTLQGLGLTGYVPAAQYDRDLSASVRQVLQFPVSRAGTPLEQHPRFRHLTVLLEIKCGRCLLFRLQRHAALDAYDLQAIAELCERASAAEVFADRLQELVGLPLVVMDEIRLDDLEPVWGVKDAAGATLIALAAQGLGASGVELSQAKVGLAREAEQSLRQLLERFIEDLEPQSRNASGWPAALDIPRYNLLAIHDPMRRRNRLQALRVLPLLAPALLNPAYDVKLRGALLRTIDAGQPLVEALSNQFGVSKAAVKHMTKVALEDIPARWIGRLGNLLRLIDALVPERRPVTAPQWQAFDALERTVAGITAQPTTSPLNLAWLREVTLDGLDETTAARIRDSTADGDIRTMLYMRLALHRWTRHRAGAAPGEGRTLPLCAAIDREIARTRLPQLRELARRWDQCLLEEQARLLEEKEKLAGRRWETLIAAPVETNGFWVVPLASAKDLAEEGKRLRHCVARYVERCFKADLMIFSLRDPQDKSLSTFALSPMMKDTRLTFVLRDHRELDDAAPRPEYQEAVTAFVRYLEVSVGAEAIQAVLSRQRLVVSADKDLAAEALFATAVERASGRALPKRFRWEALVARLEKTEALRGVPGEESGTESAPS